MRTRINNITFTPGTRSINTGITDLTVDDVRLFINESQMKVICSSMQKNNIDSIVSGVVTYKNTIPVLASGDHITFEVDLGDNGAKQGSNPNVSLTSIDEKIDDFYDTFDADMALQLQGIIGESEESVEGNSQTEGEIERLRTLQESYDALVLDSKQTIVDAINAMGGSADTDMTWAQLAQQIEELPNITMGTITWERFTPSSVADAVANMGFAKTIDASVNSIPAYYFAYNNYIQKVILRGLTTLNVSYIFNGCNSLEELEMPDLTTITAAYAVGAMPSLRKVSLPNLGTINGLYSISGLQNVKDLSLPKLVTETTNNLLFSGTNNIEKLDIPLCETMTYLVAGWPALRVVNCPKVKHTSLGHFFQYAAVNAIEVHIGENFIDNTSIANWNPTNALLNNSQSLLTDDDIAAGFTSNLEKLLYNIRTYIAALLPDRSGNTALTLTFHANIKAAILADQPTADAFTDKNWIIA